MVHGRWEVVDSILKLYGFSCTGMKGEDGVAVHNLEFLMQGRWGYGDGGRVLEFAGTIGNCTYAKLQELIACAWHVPLLLHGGSEASEFAWSLWDTSSAMTPAEWLELGDDASPTHALQDLETVEEKQMEMKALAGVDDGAASGSPAGAAARLDEGLAVEEKQMETKAAAGVDDGAASGSPAGAAARLDEGLAVEEKQMETKGAAGVDDGAASGWSLCSSPAGAAAWLDQGLAGQENVIDEWVLCD